MALPALRRSVSLAATTVLLAGCTPARILLAPTSDEVFLDRGRVSARFRVPQGLPGGLDVIVRTASARRVHHDPRNGVDVELRVSVENRSETRTATVTPGRCSFVDARGLPLALLSPAPGDPLRSGPLTLPPGERRELLLRFGTDRTCDPCELAPARLRLALDYDGEPLPLDACLFEEVIPRGYDHDPWIRDGWYGPPRVWHGGHRGWGSRLTWGGGYPIY